MFEKFIEKAEGILFTSIGGVFLFAGLILDELNVSLPLDLAWVTIIISGLPIVYSAIKKLVKNKGISKISSALLISVAMIASVLIGDLFAAGEVAFIMAIGEILEHLTTKRAKKGLFKLISIIPTQARIIKNNEEKIIKAEQIKVNDVLRVFPGEKFPVDAVVINGETTVDQSVMTGESVPVDKEKGDEVFSGTVNMYGSVDVKATKICEDSSLSRLVKLVKEAENNKSPIAKLADKTASYLVPAAFFIAILTVIFTKDIVRAVTVLVVFCPCALVLATPTAIMAAIGQATKHGVIIKSGESLEQMGFVNAVAFDKTGTLTRGKLSVSDIVVLNKELNETKILSIAASLESKSEHPIGKTVFDFAKNKNIDFSEPKNFKMFAGKGVLGFVNGENIFCGNENFISENNIEITNDVKIELEKLKKEGKAIVIVANKFEVLGVIALTDILRKEAEKSIKQLKKTGITPILLTGDNNLTAKYFAEQIGITEVFSDLLPEEKVEKIKELQKNGKKVCMVGDGVNDAPSLKTADVGIAMARVGSDIAVEAADIAFINEDISKILYMKKLSDATVKTIKLGIALSLIINVIAVCLSVLNLLNPTTGALVHNGGAFFVILIASLLYDRKFK